MNQRLFRSNALLLVSAFSAPALTQATPGAPAFHRLDKKPS